MTKSLELSVNSIAVSICIRIHCFIEWIGSRWRDFNTAFCDSTVPNFSLIGIALLLSACFNVFVVWCGGCIAIRISGSLSRPSHAKVPPSEKPAKNAKTHSKDFSARD